MHHHLDVFAFSERTVVARGSAVVIDRDVPLAIAVFAGCGVLTGVGAVLNTGGVRPSDSVVVFGMGGVACRRSWARRWRTPPLIAVDPVPAKASSRCASAQPPPSLRTRQRRGFGTSPAALTSRWSA